MSLSSRFHAATIAALFLPAALAAQAPASADCSAMPTAMDHAMMDHSGHDAMITACATLPKSPGQAAYGAISEVVRLLEADPHTDWSRVNIEALRQHLIDMDEVTLHAAVRQHNVPGGMQADVTGTGRTAGAITRMLAGHAMMLDQSADYRASTVAIPGGLRLTVTARNSTDSATVTRIRGLGFAGILTEGDHHASHHIALARGENSPHDH
jgi:hypothetical protein